MTNPSPSNPSVNDYTDSISFDEMLNALYAFETQCETIRTSIDHHDPQACRQASDLKRDIHLLRKTIEKQGLE